MFSSDPMLEASKSGRKTSTLRREMRRDVSPSRNPNCAAATPTPMVRSTEREAWAALRSAMTKSRNIVFF